MVRLIKQVWKVCGIYLVWTILHFGASQLYTKFCTPLTLIGFISSPFLVTSPHCQAFKWCINNGSDALSSMWIVFGTWIISHLS